MEEKIAARVKEITSQIECRKGFQCCNTGFKDLCKAKDIGLDNHLLCLEEKSHRCEFVVPFGYEYMCHCPVRLYLMKELGR